MIEGLYTKWDRYYEMIHPDIPKWRSKPVYSGQSDNNRKINDSVAVNGENKDFLYYKFINANK